MTNITSGKGLKCNAGQVLSGGQLLLGQQLLTKAKVPRTAAIYNPIPPRRRTCHNGI
ncbi:MAG: hypothetical protein JXA30_12140 [Deltaproteobacteria bacterium]|nr:hypothetical protein [Deltaproteobacteria bacterium]